MRRYARCAMRFIINVSLTPHSIRGFDAVCFHRLLYNVVGTMFVLIQKVSLSVAFHKV